MKSRLLFPILQPNRTLWQETMEAFSQKMENPMKVFFLNTIILMFNQVNSTFWSVCGRL